VQFAFNLLDGEQKGHIRVDDVVALGLSISKLLRAMRATAPLSANEVHRHSARYFAELDGGADGTVSFAQFRRALQVRLRRPCLAALHSVTGGRVIFAGFVCLLSVEAAPSALYRDAGTATPTSHCPPHSHGLAAQPCGRVCPHLRRDSPASAAGLACICAGTCPHLRRDLPTPPVGTTQVATGASTTSALGATRTWPHPPPPADLRGELAVPVVLGYVRCRLGSEHAHHRPMQPPGTSAPSPSRLLQLCRRGAQVTVH
jgi:hypothetical protein